MVSVELQGPVSYCCYRGFPKPVVVVKSQSKLCQMTAFYLLIRSHLFDS